VCGVTFAIPGVETVHDRTAWVDPLYPISGLPALWDQVTAGVAHYTAADDLIDGDPGEHADDLPGYLRAMNRNYWTVRGYALGYWFAVDWLGGVWRIRGWEYRSAANAGKLTGSNANPWTAPVLYLVDGDDRLTAEAARSGRMIYREADRRAALGITNRPRGHGELDATDCPGAGIRLDIAAGLLDRDHPESEDDDMVQLLDIRRPPDNAGIPASAPWLVVYSNGVVRAAVTDDPDPDVAERLRIGRVTQMRDAAQYRNLAGSVGWRG
jgi:hypothetical protein